jgi:glucose/arabinose dehydrogenase
MPIAKALLVALSLLIAMPAASQPYPSSAGPLAVEQVAGGLEHPWGLAFLPDGRLLVTERPGRLRLVEDGAVSAPLAGVPPVFAQGQGGLLDIALSPDFAESGVLYLGYADPVGRGEARSAVARARLAGDRLVDLETIFRQAPAVRGGRHFGLRIVPAPDGTLFIGMGDRGLKDPAQDLDTTIGKVVRINPDGSVPADNPFVGRSGALPKIFSYGHRNIQGAGLDAQGRFWTVEHGPRGGDALHRPQPGANYGWPLYSEGVAYSGAAIYAQEPPEGVVPPIHYWVPSIAPSGLTVYDGARFPEWQGRVIVGALRSRLIAVIEPETGSEERILEGAFGRIRDVRTGPDGAIWFLTDDPDGGIFRITSARDPA